MPSLTLSEDDMDIRGEEKPPWSEDRILYLCWKGTIQEWLLAEDSETTALLAAERGFGKEAVKVEKK